MTPRTVVFVMGAGHCGSTLLDLILGSHSEAFSLGELARISKSVDAAIADPSARICGVCAGRCGFWDDQVPQFWLRLLYCRATAYGSLARRAAVCVVNPYRLLMRWSGKSVLIDSSKNSNWIHRQLRFSYRWRGVRPFLIYLQRDGRAVVNAYYRKYPERGFDNITLSWKRSTEAMERYYRNFSRGPKLRLRYEDLATHPEATVRELCSALSIPYEPEMLSYWKHDHHHVFGNGGTRNLIYRYREQFQPHDERTRARIVHHKQYYPFEYYDQIALAIRPDERWRRELSDSQVQRFEALAGAVNEGYS